MKVRYRCSVRSTHLTNSHFLRRVSSGNPQSVRYRVLRIRLLVEINMAGPVNMSLLSTGQNTTCFRYIKDWVAKRHGHWVDVRKYLRNPLEWGRAKRGEDGTFPQTIQAIYAQPELVAVVADLIDQVESGEYQGLLGGNCTTGYHRVYTVFHTLAEALNSLINPDGTRRYNCQHFAFQHLDSDKATDGMLVNAEKWMESPWLVMKGGPRCREELYGFESVSLRPECFTTFSKIWDKVESMNNEALSHLDRKGSDPYQHGWAFHSPTSDEVLEEEADEEHVAKVVPPPPPPPVRASRGQSSKGEVEIDDQPLRPSKRMRESDGAVDEQERVLEDWESCSSPFDPRRWASVLEGWGIDDTARMQLFLLSQYSKDGAHRANAIVGKLISKRGQGILISKPSNFVHKCIQQDRIKMGAPEHREWE